MSDNGGPGKLAALRRKLKGLTAVARDPNATEAKRANAASLKQRMQQRLDDAGAPAGDWTDNAFRLGRMAKQMKKTAAPASQKATGPTMPAASARPSAAAPSVFLRSNT